ncbi:MAG: ATP-binding protein, partial [Pseudomonadota bacterium]
DNPDFRADMLVTLHNSSDKLNTLLSRLSRYGSGQAANVREIDLADVARQVVQRFKTVHEVVLTRADAVLVNADADALEQALVHLVQNAVDASGDNDPVFLSVTSDVLSGHIEVIDSGTGMNAEFVRSGLFKPFVSSKQDGFGIGAFEAREMIKAMDGRLMVESREGMGTRFCVQLPMAEAARLIERRNNTQTGPVSSPNSDSQEVA